MDAPEESRSLEMEFLPIVPVAAAVDDDGRGLVVNFHRVLPVQGAGAHETPAVSRVARRL